MFWESSKRYSILCLETAEEYLEKRRIRDTYICKAIDIYLSSYENDCCEGGCKGKRCREVWGVMCCYDCFYHSLSCEGSVSVPSMSPSQMRDYMDEAEWDEIWEQENGFV